MSTCIEKRLPRHTLVKMQRDHGSEENHSNDAPRICFEEFRSSPTALILGRVSEKTIDPFQRLLPIRYNGSENGVDGHAKLSDNRVVRQLDITCS